MGMNSYRDTAVVLRVHKLGEADRIITLLSGRYGKIRAAAKGIRRTSSRFGARLEPFSHIDVQLHVGRSLDVITQVQTLDAFGVDIIKDYGVYTTACAVLETADQLTPEEGLAVPRVFTLVVSALRALAEGEREPGLVLDAFLLRALAHSGWAPAITECAKCADPGPHRAFSVEAGGSVCPRCRPAKSVLPHQDTLVHMAALRNGNWARVEDVEPAQRREASGLIAALLQWHLERSLRTLPLVERVQ
jgi:DNA repair protein RecO (recombination protein O)